MHVRLRLTLLGRLDMPQDLTRLLGHAVWSVVVGESSGRDSGEVFRLNQEAPPDPMHAAQQASVNYDPSQQQFGCDGGSNGVVSQATVQYHSKMICELWTLFYRMMITIYLKRSQ